MDPTLKTATRAALKAGLPEFSPQMKTAAQYILDHPSEFGLDPIRQTASKAKVSTYTLVKIAKSLGFSTYEAFRTPFRHALVAGSDGPNATEWLQEFDTQSSGGAVYQDAAQNALANVGHSLKQQDVAALERLANVLIGAGSVYLTAVRSSYAVAYYMHYVGRMALPSLQLIPRHQNSAIDDLNDATAADVLIAITVTPYSRETVEACAFAQKKGAKLVLITDSADIPDGLKPDHTLVTSVLSTHHFGCLSGMMAVIEVLMAFLIERGGVRTQRRIDSYQQLRADQDVFVPTQKKH